MDYLERELEFGAELCWGWNRDSQHWNIRATRYGVSLFYNGCEQESAKTFSELVKRNFNPEYWKLYRKQYADQQQLFK